MVVHIVKLDKVIAYFLDKMALLWIITKKKRLFLPKDTLLMLKVTHILKWSSNNVYKWVVYRLVVHMVKLDWDIVSFLVKMALLWELTTENEFSCVQTPCRWWKLLTCWNGLPFMDRYEMIIDL